ncbi:UbiA family prenyltransferase [bacterium]|nr:UbiA family prenyltransferase [bacterium]
MAPTAEKAERSDLGEMLWRRADAVTKHIGLTKPSVSFLMAASASTVYVVREPDLDGTALGVIFSLFLLFLGGATLNNYQDRDLDTRLRRTRRRPLPAREIAARAALIQAVALILAGTLGLFSVGTSIALPIAGLLAIFFYNFVYTPLKRKTVLAVIPGALCGILPVLMGWMAAGGGLQSPRLWILIVVFGVWQLPHFWLVVLANERDYRRSGIPNMLRFLTVRQLRKLVFVWVTAFLVLSLLLPVYGVVLSDSAMWVLLGNALILTSLFGFLLFLDRGGDRYRELFRYLNLSVAIVMGVIVVDVMAFT